MMTMLFLSFIKKSPSDVGNAMVSNWRGMILGFVLRLWIAPIIAYYITSMLYPPLALPILLLAGVSTGVSSPFFMTPCKGNISYCLVMAASTSLFVPASLPFMVTVLAHSSLNYDLLSMAIFLATVILIPLIAAFCCRKFSPAVLNQINSKAYR